PAGRFDSRLTRPLRPPAPPPARARTGSRCQARDHTPALGRGVRRPPMGHAVRPPAPPAFSRPALSLPAHSRQFDRRPFRPTMDDYLSDPRAAITGRHLTSVHAPTTDAP